MSLFVSLFISLFTYEVQARPEYAVRYGINRCTACHFSPAGGGPRNLNGKYFGAFGYKPENWVQTHEALGLETKFLFYKPNDGREVRGGLGLMQGSVWAQLPLQTLTSDTPELRLVAEQNLGGFGPGPRQWYLRWNRSTDSETSWSPQYILFGRIIPAFGLMTDEHRTYVRIQSATPWNVGLDQGLSLAANPTDSWHYDLALMNGKKNVGNQLTAEYSETWGATANLRWLSTSYPFSLGLSHSYLAPVAGVDQATATSISSIISFHRMSHNRIPLSLSLEVVQAQNWLDNTAAGAFVSDVAYAASVLKSKSQGYYALLEWELSQRLIAQYKFDQLALNQDFPADSYVRHGLGFKHYIGNNFWGLVRFEKATANHPGESGGIKTGAESAAWMVLNLSL